MDRPRQYLVEWEGGKAFAFSFTFDEASKLIRMLPERARPDGIHIAKTVYNAGPCDPYCFVQAHILFMQMVFIRTYKCETGVPLRVLLSSMETFEEYEICSEIASFIKTNG